VKEAYGLLHGTLGLGKKLVRKFSLKKSNIVLMAQERIERRKNAMLMPWLSNQRRITVNGIVSSII